MVYNVFTATFLFVCATALTGFAQVQLPIELSTWNVKPQTEVVSVDVPLSANAAEKLYLQIHNIRFGGQVSVSVNGATWKHLYNHNVELYHEEEAFDGIGGIFPTIRMDVPLEPGDVVTGQENTISFRLNGTDGVTTAIRVLDFNFKDALGDFLLSADQFIDEDPSAWTAPSHDSEAIDAGRALWRDGVLLNDSISQVQINANCMSCHFEDGSDLKYFNYSNKTIIDRSRFHGLSYKEGEQIASYIRTRDTIAPGRPWNPPFQPGANVDPKPSDSTTVQAEKAASWLAGAGIEAVTDVNQQDLFDAIFPEGSGNGDVADLMDHANLLNLRELPLPVMMPDWNMWLPDHAPEDMWDHGLMLDDYNTGHRLSYLNGTRLVDGPYLVFEVFKNTLETETVASLTANNQLDETITNFNKGIKNWFGGIKRLGRNNLSGDTAVSLARKPEFDRAGVLQSLTRWTAIRVVEVMRNYDLEDKHDDVVERRKLYPRFTPEVLNIPSSTTLSNVFSIAPHIITYNNANFPGQEERTGKFESNQWYLLSLILNAGTSSIIRDNVPLDWAYTKNHLIDAQDRSGMNMSLVRLAFQVKMLQTNRTGVGIDQGGFTQRTNAPNFFYSSQFLERDMYRGGLNEYQDGLWEVAFEEFLYEWLYILESYSVDTVRRDDGNADRHTLEKSDFVPVPWVANTSGKYFAMPSEVTATALYRLLPLVHKDGINEALLIDFQEWCKKAWPYDALNWGSTPSWDTLFVRNALFMENFEDGLSMINNISDPQFAIKDANFVNKGSAIPLEPGSGDDYSEPFGVPRNGGGAYIGRQLISNTEKAANLDGIDVDLSGSSQVQITSRQAVYSETEGAVPGTIETRVKLTFDDGSIEYSDYKLLTDRLFGRKFETIEHVLDIPDGATQIVDLSLEWSRASYSGGAFLCFDNILIMDVSPDLDITAPPVPSSLSLSNNRDLNGEIVYVNIRVNMPSKPADLAGYNIYRWEDGQSEDDAIKITRDLLHSFYNTFPDRSVLQDQQYHYKATAVDYSGNESPRSQMVTRTIVDRFNPDVPKLAWVSVGQDSLHIGVFAVPDVDTVGYRLYRRASEFETEFTMISDEFNPLESLSYEDRDVSEGMVYEYYVDAVDRGGRTSSSPVVKIGFKLMNAPAYHLDASIPEDVTTNGSGIVTKWNDRSMHSHEASPVLPSTPLYPSLNLSASGVPGVDFKSDSQALGLLSSVEQDAVLDFNGAAGGSSGFAAVVIFRVGSFSPKWNDILGNDSDFSGGAGFCVRLNNLGKPSVTIGGITAHASNKVSLGETVVYILNYDKEAGEFDFWNSDNDETIQGVVAAANFSMNNSITLGRSNNVSRYFNGEVFEVALFDRKLSETEIIEFKTSLVNKWITGGSFLSDGWQIEDSASDWLNSWSADIGELDIDYDKDGKSNFLEYALGGDPTFASAELILPELKYESGEIVYVFKRRKYDASINYVVETTTDLSADELWAVNPTATVMTRPYDFFFDEVVVSIPESEERLFVRLEIE